MEKPTCSWDPIPSPPLTSVLRWREPLETFPGALWVIAAEPDWINAGKAVLRNAGIEEADNAEYRSTFLEIKSQSLGGLAQALTKRLKREVKSAGAGESESQPASAKWAEMHVQLSGISFTLTFGIEDALLPLLGDATPAADPAQEAGATVATINPSKTFDLLLDVELPVSVSFGRAQIPLKDVLKLNTGSIVELNRSIVEPVEIIVNNCVIARGEVVVVDGNFGVRVQEVISRQERLRTLQ